MREFKISDLSDIIDLLYEMPAYARLYGPGAGGRFTVMSTHPVNLSQSMLAGGEDLLEVLKESSAKKWGCDV